MGTINPSWQDVAERWEKYAKELEEKMAQMKQELAAKDNYITDLEAEVERLKLVIDANNAMFREAF